MSINTEFGKLWRPGVYELRVIGVDGSKRIDSGYFDDLELLSRAAARYDGRAAGIYVTVNVVNPALLARSANRVIQHAKLTTSDADVSHRRWLLVDLDPVRPAGISSTESEHEAAHEVAAHLVADMAADGWPAPVIADSGNGAHVLWEVDWPNTQEVTATIQSWLAYLAGRYGNHSVAVDRTVFNAARIWKLYGTLACKGSSTADRPHRASRVIRCGSGDLLDIRLLQQTASGRDAVLSTWRLAATRHAEKSEPRDPGGFSVEAFMAQHFPDAEQQSWNGGKKWVLDKCPWNSTHVDRSAYVAVLPSGAISAGCHHNGCSGNDWHGLRRLLSDRPTMSPGPDSAHASAHSPSPTHAQSSDLPLTPDEGGLADLWLSRHGSDRVWAVGWESWMVWSGKLWQRDNALAVRAEIDDLLCAANAAAEQMAVAAGPDKAAARRAGRFVTATQRTSTRVRGIEQLAQPRLAVHSRLFDQSNVLNLDNGTLDLDTFDFREHRPGDRLTSCMSYAFDEDAAHPMWSTFLRHVLVDEDGRHDESLARLLQELFGYSLTTHTYMQSIVFQKGDGGNGKSVATAVLASLLEDLAITVEFDKLGELGNHDLARIPGRRALLSTESKKGGRRIPEDVLKRIADGEPLTSNQKYEVPFEFRPVAKIWWSMNHLPRITDTTASIWRRLQVLPYNRKISDAERDVHLVDKLHAERSGILNWSLLGLERVMSRRAFTVVPQVAVTVDEYRRGSDPVGMYVDECCDTEPSIGRSELWTGASALFENYVEWARRNQFDKLGYLSAREFANEMKRLGLPGKRSGVGVRYPVLIKLPDSAP